MLENIALYSCYFIGQLQESILLRVHWISIYRVHALIVHISAHAQILSPSQRVSSIERCGQYVS